MGVKNKITRGYKYFITMTVVDWVDVFTRPTYRHVIVDSLEYCQKHKGLIVNAWCVMSNHIHLILESKEGFNLSDTIRDFKKYTSKRIIEVIKESQESRKIWMLKHYELAGIENKKIKNYKFWKDGNEAKEIHSTLFMEQKLNYIHNNPVVAEIVDEPYEYRYSSARDYCGKKGLLEIELIE